MNPYNKKYHYRMNGNGTDAICNRMAVNQFTTLVLLELVVP